MIIFEMNWAKPHHWKNREGTLLFLYVQPGASRAEIKGIHGDRLKISIQSPPVDGAANEALVEWLSQQLGVAKSQIHLLSGERSRQKNLWVNLPLDSIRSWLVQD